MGLPPGLAVDADSALLRAVESMTQGHFDSRTADGAQANALESIAWSLIGLLQSKTVDGYDLDDGTKRDLSEALLRSGFVRLPDQD